MSDLLQAAEEQVEGAAELAEMNGRGQAITVDPAETTGLIGFVQRRLNGVTLEAAAFPLIVLFLIYFFDEFDTAAFGVLEPKIRHAFDLSVQGFGGVVAANLIIVLAAAVPLGYYGDRLPRRAIVVVGAAVAGTFSFLTGLAPTVLILLLVRIGNGFGVVVNDPIHRSLLS